ncbi:MAG TPA: hypothetical protein VM534_06275 [Thermoanaerobaculia bacterium]|nr:hypothetical protein [Thermoanaerobaculia bacterium]
MTVPVNECPVCRRAIDEAARLCPYCSADIRTGQRPETRQILAEHFPPTRPERSRLDVLRHRQGLILAAAAAVVLLMMFGIHQMITKRNREAGVAHVPAIPLTEVADLANQEEEREEIPMPDLEFQHLGNARAAETFLVEPGAASPPPSPADGAKPEGPVQGSAPGRVAGD